MSPSLQGIPHPLTPLKSLLHTIFSQLPSLLSTWPLQTPLMHHIHNWLDAYTSFQFFAGISIQHKVTPHAHAHTQKHTRTHTHHTHTHTHSPFTFNDVDLVMHSGKFLWTFSMSAWFSTTISIQFITKITKSVYHHKVGLIATTKNCLSATPGGPGIQPQIFFKMPILQNSQNIVSGVKDASFPRLPMWIPCDQQYNQ